MSIDLVGACLWLDLPPARKLVLLALCDRANMETGECWPGRADIAIRASLSERSVTPHLKGLETAGWVKLGKHPRRPGLTTKKYVNVDRIIAEGELRRLEFKHRRGQEESSPTPDEEGKLTALGQEVDGRRTGSSLHEEGKLTVGGQEVDATVTVIEPSLVTVKEPLKEPVQDFSFFDEWLKVKGQPHWDDPRKKSTIADAQRRAVVKRVQKLSRAKGAG